MKLIDFSSSRRQYIIKMTLYMTAVFIFSLIYNTCDDNEFAGWVDSSSNDLLKEDKYLSYIFSKMTNNKEYMNLNTFLKLPIYIKNNNWFILNERNKITDSYKMRKEKIKLFDTFNNKYITKTNFLNISISISNLKKYSLPYNIKFPGTFNAPDGSAVHNYFDRLYFSFTTQSLLGFGDIFPISKRTRIIALIQSLSSIFILYL